MKNFPSALIQQKSTRNILTANLASTAINIGKTVLKNTFGKGDHSGDVTRINNGFNKGYEIPSLNEKLNDINLFKPYNVEALVQESKTRDIDFLSNYYNGCVGKDGVFKSRPYIEDPFVISSFIFSSINNYKYVWNQMIPYVIDGPAKTEEGSKEIGVTIAESANSPSLFNPYVGIKVVGLTENLPLLNEDINITSNFDSDNLFSSDIQMWEEDDELNINENSETQNSINEAKKTVSDANNKELKELNQQLSNKQQELNELTNNSKTNDENKSETDKSNNQQKIEQLGNEIANLQRQIAEIEKKNASGDQWSENQEINYVKINKNMTDVDSGKVYSGEVEAMKSSIFSKIEDISDCSVQTLVKLSHNASSELGMATYRYADFMFCKDLGKIPNNRLITLRRFSAPCRDNIFKWAHPKYKKLSKQMDAGDPDGFFDTLLPDVGRMVTWFGNDDNKLENICRYNYHATWKNIESKFDIRESEQKEYNPSSSNMVGGIVHGMANFLSPQNNVLVAKGFSSNHAILSMLAQKLHVPIIGNGASEGAPYSLELLKNYDQHKVYEPKNTMRSINIYDGELKFEQSMTIVFRYTLRSYANINPKAAFLDLIGNIQATTYRRGSFWGGENRVVGGQGNSSVYRRSNAMVNNAFHKLGGIWARIANGDIGLQEICGWLSALMSESWDIAKNIINGAGNVARNIVEGGAGEAAEAAGSMIRKGMQYISKLDGKYHWSDALKGMVHNELGRPAVYAFNTILTGEPTGVWHLTIGNPRNPIMAIGNLKLDDAIIEHSGPLGLDDFPTELKVTVTLSHCMPRDSVLIEKMYTKGAGSIYTPLGLMNTQNYYNNYKAFPDLNELVGDKDILKMSLSAL